ncbi:hypothetical protein [Cellulomonas composti]|uniref:Uncharacterized protein n=1 Tax=Cellulomonas composti TaxID=266130 RepID=A0A511J646_9CELL|nr:hypothetical protein [Cellulomonas composti]GEL93458.1 hypothetical protein CCO02nite_01160 [Cellulomonas composti]
MTYDLRRSLRALEQDAPTVALDVHRIDARAAQRRRRRVGGTTVGAVAVVAAVALAVPHASWTTSAPPAQPAPTGVVPTGAPTCGDVMPATVADEDLVVSVFHDATPSWGVGAAVLLEGRGEAALDVAATPGAVYLVQDGRVVAVGSQPFGDGELAARGRSLTSVGIDPVDCGTGQLLPDGDYRVYAYQRAVASGMETEHVALGGGLPVRLADGQEDLGCGAPVAVPATVPESGAVDLTGVIVDDGTPGAVARLSASWQDVPGSTLVSARTTLAFTDADGAVVGYADPYVTTTTAGTSVELELPLAGLDCGGVALPAGDYGVVGLVTWYLTGAPAPEGPSASSVDLGRHAVPEPTGTCGEIVLGQGEQVPATAWACLDAATGTGATLVVTFPTTEGDPIVTTYRVGPDVDGLEITTDATQDRFGGPDAGISTETCPDTVTAAEPLGCRPA